jgi:DNA-binding transcriptional MocR family regulator
VSSLRDGSRYTARELRDRARATGLVPTLRHVYMVLDSYANGAPECYASQATLAADVGCSRSTMQGALDDLEEVGAIERVRGAGSNGTTLYKIADPPGCKSSNDASPGAGHAREPGTRVKVKDQLLTAEQQEQELKELPLVPGSRAPGSRAGTNAKSASRPAKVDPKPTPKRSKRLVRKVNGEVGHAKVRTGEVELVEDRSPIGFQPVEGGAAGGAGKPRLTGAERMAKAREDAKAAARRGAR